MSKLNLQGNAVGLAPAVLEEIQTSLACVPISVLQSYGDPMGNSQLRELLSHWHKAPDHTVLITGSATEALMLLWLGLMPKSVLLQDPCYFDCHRQLQQLNIPYTGCHYTGDWDFSAATQYIQYRGNQNIASPAETHFVGIVRNKSQAQHLILDDSYGLTIGQNFPKLQEFEFYVGSFSKLFGPSLRMGYLVIPNKFVPQIKKAKIACSLATNSLIQAVTLDLLQRNVHHTQVSWYTEQRTTWLTSGLPFDPWNGGIQLRLPTTVSQYKRLQQEFCIDQNHWYWKDPNDLRAKKYVRLNYTLHEPNEVLAHLKICY